MWGVGMILVPLIYVKENDVLGKNLIDRDHKILLKKGMALKKSQIKRLMDLGYNNVYISSRINYEPEEFISSESRDALMKQMRKTYGMMKKSCEFENRKTSSKNTSSLIKLDDEIVDEIKVIHEEALGLVGDIISSKKDYLDYVTVKNFINYPFNHAIDTGVLATLIGRKLGMNARKLIDVFMAAVVSELSNACLPDQLLNKKGKLEDFEFELIKRHPENGYRTAKNCWFLSPNVKVICLSHHERMDGMGYPNNLFKEDINISARVLAVADAYDSLTSSRTYRPAYLPHKALSIIASEIDKAYDPDVVQALSEVIVPYPIGSVVKLNTDVLGFVVGIHRDRPERPILITTDSEQPEKVDLKLETDLSIIGLKYDF